jgi:hypothetical protein
LLADEIDRGPYSDPMKDNELPPAAPLTTLGKIEGDLQVGDGGIFFDGQEYFVQSARASYESKVVTVTLVRSSLWDR